MRFLFCPSVATVKEQILNIAYSSHYSEASQLDFMHSILCNFCLWGFCMYLRFALLLCPCLEKTGMCSDYWTEEVPGHPQRHTKAQRNAPQGAFLIHDSACLREQPQEFKDQTASAIACFHLIPTLFFPLLSFANSLFVLSLALHPFHFESAIPPLLFFPTHFSLILPMSSIIIFSPSLSCLISSPALLPVSLAISHFFLQHYLSTLCTYHQNFSFCCHHLSLATGEGSEHVEICRSTVCGGCVCTDRQTDRHWVNVIKGWCSSTKWQRDWQEEKAALKQL